MQDMRRRSLLLALACCVIAAAGPTPASAAQISQPCRVDFGSAPDGELQRLAAHMTSTASATVAPPRPGDPPAPSPPPPQVRVGPFQAIDEELGDQAGAGSGLDNGRGTFFVRFGPGPLDAAAVHARFVAAVERLVPAEHVAAIRSRLRVVAQPYPQAELETLRASLTRRVQTEFPGVPVAGSIGCHASEDVRLELDLYDPTSVEDEAAIRRIAAEHGDRVVVLRRPHGPPVPGGAPGSVAPLPLPPPGPLPQLPPDRPEAPAPRAPRATPTPGLLRVLAVRRRCGARPQARVALAPAWRSRVRAFRLATRPSRRTATTVSLRRAIRVRVSLRDGRTITGRIARCGGPLRLR